MGHDIWDERRRSYEAEYFRRREAELIARMRAADVLAADRREIGERIGVADDELLEGLRALGYTRETVTLVHLVPLLQVAWADGEVSKRERNGILEAARARGVGAGTSAHRQLEEWLDHRPPDAFFEDTLRLIGYLLHGLPEAERDHVRRDLLHLSTVIATVSGGLLGVGSRVSREERLIIARIAREIDTASSRLPLAGPRMA
jgi:hypothetical protein